MYVSEHMLYRHLNITTHHKTGVDITLHWFHSSSFRHLHTEISEREGIISAASKRDILHNPCYATKIS
jgi:hypothetical protein